MMNPHAVIKKHCHSDTFMGAMMNGMLRAYSLIWWDHTNDLEVLSVEKTYWCPLYNLDTNRRSRKFVLSGKLDKVVREDGKIVLYDHKTTSSKIDATSDYWRVLQIEGQPKQYEILLRANGIEVDRIVWDVARKPQIRPKKIAQAARTSISETGKYFDADLTEETMDALSGIWLDKENPEMFEARVFDTVHRDPTEYFARRSIPTLKDDLYTHNQNMWDLSGNIVAARKRYDAHKRHTYNAGACFQYGTACTYLGICEGSDSPDSGNWARGEVHPELDLDEIDSDKEVLTNSRLKCFQTCQRKHHFRYELGLEKHNAKDGDALFFGTVWHHVMDAYWAEVSGFQLKGGDSDGNRN
jgi:hypothetical protein